MSARLLPPEEAWDNLLESLLNEEADRIARLSREELDRELRADGVDPTALAARARALIARLEAAKPRR